MSTSKREGNESTPLRVGRRTVLAGLGALTLLGGVVGAKPGKSNGKKDQSAVGAGGGPGVATAIEQNTLKQRLTSVYQFRQQTAHDDVMPPQPPAQLNNGDRELGSWAVYGKCLKHDVVEENGEPVFGYPNPDAVERMIGEIKGTDTLHPDDIAGDRGLVNPRSAKTYGLVGRDWYDVTIPPAPSVTSDETGAELVELYWQSLLRDTAFLDFRDDETAKHAAMELAMLDVFTGPTPVVSDDGTVPVDAPPDLHLFRGTLPGSTIGPHVSQFLLHSIPRTEGLIQDQKYFLAPEADYMTDVADWLSVQQGVTPQAFTLNEDDRRFIHDGRGLTTAVHFDAIFELPMNAALILFGDGYVDQDFALSFDLLGKTEIEEGFVDFGIGDVLTAVADVSRPALHAAWVQKWDVHLRPRPEALGGAVNATMQGYVDYSDHLSSTILDSYALEAAEAANGSYLLSQAFPEGSPCHPSYPAGHSSFSGACVTVLKAYFDEDAEILNPVFTDPTGSDLLYYTDDLPWYDGPLTVGHELNKLADNIAIGRNWAGIHYRTDATAGYRLGEAIALAYLVDRARTYADSYGFDGFSLTTFDGETVHITADGVEYL
ncbi:vanadium-dependent haloperoxidase [Haloarchaeobius sp. DYHT-AS-18]|uniref:vanadium-dependent haloperoxidase n=1 Tax=Haloarchaeobius sp. DYHT-AS-18 TaxID=3446117 RepID=UPI003EBEECF8